MKYLTATWTRMGQILKILKLLPVYLLDRVYLSVAVTSDKYCIFGRVQGSAEDDIYVENVSPYAAEFGKVTRGFWTNLPQKTVVHNYIC